jgi:hypothetical protein
MPDPNCSICNGTGFKIVERGGLRRLPNANAAPRSELKKIKTALASRRTT